MARSTAEHSLAHAKEPHDAKSVEESSGKANDNGNENVEEADQVIKAYSLCQGADFTMFHYYGLPFKQTGGRH